MASEVRSPVPPRRFLLSTNICCSKMERKVQRILETTSGVQSFRIDRKGGTVLISGAAEPSRIMTLLQQRMGLRSELLWDQLSPAAPVVGLPVSYRPADEMNVTVQLKRIQASVEIKLSMNPQNEPFSDPPPQQLWPGGYAPTAPMETDNYHFDDPPPPPPATFGSVFDQPYDEGPMCMIM